MRAEVQADLQLFFDQSTRADPYAVLTRLREASPVSMLGGVVVMVARFAHCSTALRSRGLSSKRPGSPSFFSLDPPEHTRLRGLTAKAFTPKRVDASAPLIQQTVDDLLDAVAPIGTFDLVSDLAYPVTARTICDMLGVPRADHAVFRDWTRIITHDIDPRIVPDSVFDAQVLAARESFYEYFRPLVAHRREHPGDDLITALVEVSDGGDRLSDEELLETLVLLVVAAHENPVGLVCNTMLALLRHPEQLAMVRENPALAEAAVEETLRYDPPAQLTGRTTTAELRLGEMRVPEGVALFILLAAANRDPETFEEPDRFDLTRGRTQHLAFAAGPHFCMGADLAKLEATITVATLVSRLGGAAYDPDALRYKPNVSIRGPVSMPVSFSAMAPAGSSAFA